MPWVTGDRAQELRRRGGGCTSRPRGTVVAWPSAQSGALPIEGGVEVAFTAARSRARRSRRRAAASSRPVRARAVAVRARRGVRRARPDRPARDARARSATGSTRSARARAPARAARLCAAPVKPETPVFMSDLGAGLHTGVVSSPSRLPGFSQLFSPRRNCAQHRWRDVESGRLRQSYNRQFIRPDCV